MINTHHRSIAHSPVCLTHESTAHFFERIREPPPWTTILTQRRRGGLIDVCILVKFDVFNGNGFKFKIV